MFFFVKDSGEPLKPFSYIKVIGQVKVFAGKAHVVAHHINKMQSLNELIAHSIECIHASLLIRKQGETVCVKKKKNNKEFILFSIIRVE